MIAYNGNGDKNYEINLTKITWCIKIKKSLPNKNEEVM